MTDSQDSTEPIQYLISELDTRKLRPDQDLSPELEVETGQQPSLVSAYILNSMARGLDTGCEEK